MTKATAIEKLQITASGVTSSMAELALLTAVRDFHRRTNIREERVTTHLVAGTAMYSPLLPADTEFLMFRAVWADGTPYHRRNTRPLPGASQKYSRYFVDYEGALELYPTPSSNVTDGLVTDITVMPVTLDAVEGSVWDQYESVIVDGALHHLFASHNRPYTNPALAALHGRKFSSGVARVRYKLQR